MSLLQQINVIVERIDDIPIIIELAKLLKIHTVIDRNAKTHGLQTGLSNGEITLGWLSYVLSENDHCKVGLEDWARKRTRLLRTLIGKEIQEHDFCDDKLSHLLDRLSKDKVWEAIENDLWKATLEVYEIPIKGIRLDSTTSYGYHQVKDDGIMQLGLSKDHRPDLPQLKLMAAAIDGIGHIIGCNVVSGEQADDPLYTPLIVRVRNMLNKRGMLYVGDCKMASISTREEMVRHGDYYLVPLPRVGNTASDIEKWIAAATTGTQITRRIYDGRTLIAKGYETKREQNHDSTTWNERILIVHSYSYAKAKLKHLEEQLSIAVKEISALTPQRGKGIRQIYDEEVLQIKIAGIAKKREVEGLLNVVYNRETALKKVDDDTEKLSKKGKRPKATRVRYVITAVRRIKEAITLRKKSIGWRAYATNTTAETLSLKEGIIGYRAGWSIERDFDLLKNRPLGLSPLYVRNDSQITGLTRFLTIALRLITFMEMVLTEELAKQNHILVGLHRGQPKRFSHRPSATTVLSAFTREEINLTRMESAGENAWQVTTLPECLSAVLECLPISAEVYQKTIYSDVLN